jgi:hypothetical protein
VARRGALPATRAAGGVYLVGVHASSPHGDPHGGGDGELSVGGWLILGVAFGEVGTTV